MWNDLWTAVQQNLETKDLASRCGGAWKDLERGLVSCIFVWPVSPFTMWWFQICFIFTPTWGNDSIWLIFFWNGLVQPPTSLTLSQVHIRCWFNEAEWMIWDVILPKYPPRTSAPHGVLDVFSAAFSTETKRKHPFPGTENPEPQATLCSETPQAVFSYLDRSWYGHECWISWTIRWWVRIPKQLGGSRCW